MLKKRCRYDDVRSLYVDQLAFIWMEDSTTETTRARVDKKIDSFVEGDLEHAAEMLSTLWEIVNKDGDIKAPANASSTVSPFRFSLFHVSCGNAHSTSSGHKGHESRSLGLCPGRTHQVDPQGCLLR